MTKKSLSDHVYSKCAHTAQEESVIKVWLIFFFLTKTTRRKVLSSQNNGALWLSKEDKNESTKILGCYPRPFPSAVKGSE